jgi:hypothetical protein
VNGSFSLCDRADKALCAACHSDSGEDHLVKEKVPGWNPGVGSKSIVYRGVGEGSDL